MKSGWNQHAVILTSLTGLFVLRVAGQAVQFWMPQPFLPAFNEFQGSRLGYSTLLAAQLLILAAMAGTCMRSIRRHGMPNPRLGRGLAWLGGLYMAGSVGRILVGLAWLGAPAWFSAWIPAFFHLVLAAFILTLAHYHLRSSRQSVIGIVP